MSGERSVRCIDLNAESFHQSLKKIKDQNLREQIKTTLRSLLLLDLDEAPAKLHLHTLTGKKVASVRNPMQKVPAWSLHVTSNDVYKASFTFEDGTLFFRRIDTHDALDKNP